MESSSDYINANYIDVSIVCFVLVPYKSCPRCPCKGLLTVSRRVQAFFLNKCLHLPSINNFHGTKIPILYIATICGNTSHVAKIYLYATIYDALDKTYSIHISFVCLFFFKNTTKFYFCSCFFFFRATFVLNNTLPQSVRIRLMSCTVKI